MLDHLQRRHRVEGRQVQRLGGALAVVDAQPAGRGMGAGHRQRLGGGVQPEALAGGGQARDRPHAPQRRAGQVPALRQLPAVGHHGIARRQQVEPFVDEVEDQVRRAEGDQVRQGGLAQISDQGAMRLGFEAAARRGVGPDSR